MSSVQNVPGREVGRKAWREKTLPNYELVLSRFQKRLDKTDTRRKFKTLVLGWTSFCHQSGLNSWWHTFKNMFLFYFIIFFNFTNMLKPLLMLLKYSETKCVHKIKYQKLLSTESWHPTLAHIHTLTETQGVHQLVLKNFK